MKHIRPFNEAGIGPVQNHIKELINWNDVNYLVDKLSVYEEDGLSVRIDLLYYNGESSFDGYSLIISALYTTERQYNKPTYTGDLYIKQRYLTIVDSFTNGSIRYRLTMVRNDKFTDLLPIENEIMSKIPDFKLTGEKTHSSGEVLGLYIRKVS